jgi:hypothetical protein
MVERSGEETVASAGDDTTRLAYRLDALSTWLFWTAGIVALLCIVSGLLAMSTNIDTLGLLSPQAQTQGRTAVGLALIGLGLGGGGIIAGLAGVIKALVHRREL